MGLSRYLIRAATQFYFGSRSVWTYPTLHLGLFTTLPTGPDDAGTELAVAGYARRTVAGGDFSAQTTPDTFNITNANPFYFGPLATAAPVAGFGLWDAASAGNLLAYGALTAALTVPAGRAAQLPARALWLSGPKWISGPILAYIYAFPSAGYGPPTLYRPSEWRVYLEDASLPFEQWTADHPEFTHVTLANDAATWPIVGSDVTNAAAWSYDPAPADGPDVVRLLFVGKLPAGSYGPFWVARLTAAATVRMGERLEIAAGAVAFDGL